MLKEKVLNLFDFICSNFSSELDKDFTHQFNNLRPNMWGDEQQSTSENTNNINNGINFDNTSHQMHFEQDNILEDIVNYSDNSDEVQIENLMKLMK